MSSHLAPGRRAGSRRGHGWALVQPSGSQAHRGRLPIWPVGPQGGTLAGRPSPPRLATPGVDMEPGSPGRRWACSGAVWRAVLSVPPGSTDHCHFTSVTCGCWPAKNGKLAGPPAEGRWCREEPLLASSESGCQRLCTESLCPSQFPLSTGSGQTKHRGPSLPGVPCSAARARLVWPHAVLTRSRLRGAGRHEFCWQALLCQRRPQDLTSRLAQPAASAWDTC